MNSYNNTTNSIVIGEIEPSLLINIAKTVAQSDVIALTELMSTYLYLKSFAPNNVTIHLIKSKRCGNRGKNREYRQVNDVLNYYMAFTKNSEKKRKKVRNELNEIYESLIELKLPTDASCIIWNTCTIINRYLSLKYTKRLNVLENGLIRPGYITLDHRGVNYEAAVSIGKYNKLEHRIETSSPLKLTTRRSYIPFRVLEFFTFWTITSKRVLNDISKFRTNRFKLKSKQKPDIRNYRRYIFVPLQILSDSQCVLFSKYMSHEEVINDAVQIAESYCKKIQVESIRLIFKRHPHDLSTEEIKYPSSRNVVIEESHLDTTTLVSNSELVITVNSTVGFEALMLNKPVHLLGRAIYENISGIVNSQTDVADKLDLKEFTLGSQVRFDVNRYDQESLKQLVAHIK